MAKKLIFLIGDGMGDWPVEELGGLTPLEFAETPSMDALAGKCVSGLARTVPESMPPGSDVANMSLLGFDPAKHHTGRGPIEAAAQGLKLAPDDLVFRLNLVSVSAPGESGAMLDYSSGHIETTASKPLVEMLEKELGGGGISFVPGIQYRHLLVVRDGAGSPEAEVHVRPPHDITGRSIAADLRAMAGTRLQDLFERAAMLLASPGNKTRANCIWPWGQGRPLILPDFKETYGLKGAVISAVDLVKGLGRASNMEVIEVPGVTGLLDTNYEGKVAAALDFLKRGDFVYLHVEAPDECGHAGIARHKVEAVSRFDKRVVGPVVSGLEGLDAAVLVTCDHFTPLAERTHTKDPVPFLLRAPGQGEKLPGGFSEHNAAGTGLVIDPGHELLSRVLERIGG